jgi:hypothetical protein
MNNVFRLNEYQNFVFSTHKVVVRHCFFSEDMRYFYSIDKNSVLCIWKWVEDYLTEGYKNYKKFEMIKKGKKIKLVNGDSKEV